MYTLIKHLDQSLIPDYLRARKDDNSSPPLPETPKSYTPIDARPLLSSLSSIASLPEDHAAKQYLDRRVIPPAFYNQLFWTDDFAALGEKIRPGKYGHLRSEGRIVIPLLDANFMLLGVQGRSLEPDAEVRYLTLRTFDDAPKIYGLHRLKKDYERVYIVEGPLDSVFLAGCLAMTGSDIPSSLPQEKVTIIYDNAPRNPGTCKKMERAIEKGYRVFFWPIKVQQKDVNEVVIAGFEPDIIMTWIEEGSYTGVKATFKLRDWRLDK